MILLPAFLLLAAGGYALVLGFGKASWPLQWRNREETLWIGRFAIFFGSLLFLDGVGVTPHQISGWLQDILTSGGGAGTG